MAPPLPSTLTFLAKRQDGLLTRQQVLAGDVGAAEIEGHLRRGRWQRVLPQIYAIGSDPLDQRRMVRATYLWGGPDSVVIGESALWWQRRLPAPPNGPVEVAIPHMRSARSPAGVLVRRQTIAAEHRLHYDRVQVARIAHVIATQLFRTGTELLDQALRSRWVTLDQVVAVQRTRLGARHSARAGRILQDAATAAHSPAERLLHRLLRSAGITGWQANADLTIEGSSICPDVRFDTLRLLIEVDGFAFHTDHGAFENDRRRQNALVLAGWTVLRFTWRQLTDEPQRVIAEIRRAIERARVQPPVRRDR
jgi:very-short-patch-repair endonuclease